MAGKRLKTKCCCVWEMLGQSGPSIVPAALTCRSVGFVPLGLLEDVQYQSYLTDMLSAAYLVVEPQGEQLCH